MVLAGIVNFLSKVLYLTLFIFDENNVDNTQVI